MQSNNINTGLASKVDSFRWSGSMDGKPHVLGVKTSAPDFSIPPTPASSYQNIHVMLDHVHPSSLTMRSEVLSEPVQMRSAAVPLPSQGTVNRSFSNLPRAVPDNKLDDVPSSSLRLVPDRVDPDQPMARSQSALTSLKSEIAPLPRDEFAERTDRQLPPSVDISLFDETEALASRGLTKEWALQEEEERSWRMSRQVDNSWRSKWSSVGKQLTGSSSFDLMSWEDSERQWRMNRPIDNSWKSNWGLVNKELLGGSFNLNSLEERERQWRMQRPVDSLWTQNWKLVGDELTGSQLKLAIEDLNQFTAQLTLDLEREVDRIVANVNSMGPALEDLDRQLNKAAWERISAMEDEERAWRSTRSVDPIFYGNWHKVALEFKSVVGVSWSEWFDSLKTRTLKKTSRAVDRIEKFELPAISIPSLPAINLPNMSIPSLPAVHLPSVKLPDLKLGVVKSEATTPMYNDSALIDFTFKSNRVPREIIDLEEQERSWRMSRGVNPILAGLWFKLGQELKYKYSLRPTFAGLGESLVLKASNFADKAIDSFGSFVEKTQEVIASAEESLLPAPASEFADHKHLNLFAFTAEKVDFTFRSSRTPAYIIALEEAERADRIKNFESRRSGYRMWNRYLVENLPKSNIELVEGAFMGAVHKAENAVLKAETGISGFFGSLAHSVANTLHLTKEAPLAKETKVDPITAARKGRVNDELLHLTVKSV